MAPDAYPLYLAYGYRDVVPAFLGHQLTSYYSGMLCFAADTISMVTYSKRMGFMDAGEDIGDLFKNLHRNMLYSTPVGIYAWIHPLVFTSRNWLRRMGLTKESNRTFVANFTSERVSARRVERAQNEKPAVAPDDENAPRGDSSTRTKPMHRSSGNTTSLSARSPTS